MSSRIFLLVPLLIFGCARPQSSTLNADKKVDEALLKKLKADIINQKEFGKSLELAYAVSQLEYEVNGKIDLNTDDMRQALVQHLGNPKNQPSFVTSTLHLISYDVAQLALAGFLTAAAMHASSQSETKPNVRIASSAKIFTGVSIFSTSYAIGATSAAAIKTSMEKYNLSDLEKAALSKQIKRTDCSAELATIFRFVGLDAADQSSFESALTKEVIKSYDRSYTDALKETISADLLFSYIDKNVKFFKILREFKPQNPPADFAKKVEFLDYVYQGYEQLYLIFNEKEISEKEGIAMRIDILKTFSKALYETQTQLEDRKDDATLKRVRMTMTYIKERLDTLEELAAIKE